MKRMSKFDVPTGGRSLIDQDNGILFPVHRNGADGSQQGHRPEIAPSISSAAETAGMRSYVIDIVWSVIDTPKLESLGGTESPKWRP